MRKMRRRAIICLCLAAVLVVGLGFYVYKQVVNGGDWVTYPANKNIYSNGYISTGSIYDRDGELLLQHNGSDTPIYNDNAAIRSATLHTVGDIKGNIATGANQVFADKLIGYNFLFGTYSTNHKGRNLYLTIDADICRTAYEALGGQNGCVGVYNYKTGDLVCMVSAPNYDPLYPPTISGEDTSGTYLNKLLSTTAVPGSTFKVITSTAALETLDNLDSWTYTCTGTKQYGDAPNDRVTCSYAHGTQSFRDALANSCNCAFAELSNEIGKSDLKEYTKKSGIMNSYSINGIKTVKSTVDFPGEDVTLAWTGIGQYHDMVNPCSLMIYMGAIANGGKTVSPRIIDSVKYTNGWNAGFKFKDKTAELVDPSTARELDELLHNNVVKTYGEYNFQGLDLCAKSGTAEVGGYKQPHSWFVGYIRNDDYPYAFVTLVENGGSGASVAGAVTNKVLQGIISKDSLKSE